MDENDDFLGFNFDILKEWECIEDWTSQNPQLLVYESPSITKEIKVLCRSESFAYMEAGQAVLSRSESSGNVETGEEVLSTPESCTNVEADKAEEPEESKAQKFKRQKSSGNGLLPPSPETSLSEYNIKWFQVRNLADKTVLSFKSNFANYRQYNQFYSKRNEQNTTYYL